MASFATAGFVSLVALIIMIVLLEQCAVTIFAKLVAVKTLSASQELFVPMDSVTLVALKILTALFLDNNVTMVSATSLAVKAIPTV